MADMTKLQEAGRLPDADGTLTAGTCDAILTAPPGWDEAATANWRTLQQEYGYQEISLFTFVQAIW
jgi:hypothetical protein